MTPDKIVQVPAPEGLDCRLNPVAALCVLSTAGVLQVTMRPLPLPCVSDTALGGFGICCVVATGEFGCPNAYIMPWGRFVAGVVGYLGILLWFLFNVE